MNLTIYNYREGENWQRLNGGLIVGHHYHLPFVIALALEGKERKIWQCFNVNKDTVF